MYSGPAGFYELNVSLKTNRQNDSGRKSTNYWFSLKFLKLSKSASRKAQSADR